MKTQSKERERHDKESQKQYLIRTLLQEFYKALRNEAKLAWKEIIGTGRQFAKQTGKEIEAMDRQFGREIRRAVHGR